MTVISIRSRDLAPAHRLDAFQDAVAAITKVRFTPEDRENFSSETTIVALPDVILGHARHSPSNAVRTPDLAAESGDNVLLHFPMLGGYTIRQRGGAAYELQPGFVYADPDDMPAEITYYPDASECFYVSIPRAHLEPATGDLNGILRNRLELTPRWRLFLSYVQSLHQETPHLPGDTAMQYAMHVRDLALIALGGRGEAQEIAAGRGLRVARLAALKRDIAAHLADSELTLEMLAGRHGISPSYIRALFSDEGVAFSDYVRAQRLQKARAMIASPNMAHMLISTIAFECGFSDISWFNKAFKRRFGRSPSDVRRVALSEAVPTGAE